MDRYINQNKGGEMKIIQKIFTQMAKDICVYNEPNILKLIGEVESQVNNYLETNYIHKDRVSADRIEKVLNGFAKQRTLSISDPIQRIYKRDFNDLATELSEELGGK